jgi:MFS family permease
MLSRYAIADLAPAHERARALGRSLLAVACGSILGPLLLDPAGRTASALGTPAASGSYASAAIVLLLASLVVAGRPGNAVVQPLASTADRRPPAAVTDASNPVRRALFALAAANLTMVAMMAVYPSHLHHAGHSLGITGFVVSAHVWSMFAMSPIIGRCTDRYGANQVVIVGAAIICFSCLFTAVLPIDNAGSATIALVTLGIGWNAQLVAASALLTHNAEPDRCAQLESHGEIAMSAAAAVGALALAPWLFAQTGIRPLAAIMIPLNAIVAATTIAALRTRRTARALTTETTT